MAHDVPGTFLPQLRFKQRMPDIGSGAHIFVQFFRTAPIPFSLGLIPFHPRCLNFNLIPNVSAINSSLP